MHWIYRSLAAAAGLLPWILITDAAYAQKRGGILKVYHVDSPPSASIHEEATFLTVTPFMGVFNNLVMYKQDIAQNRLDTIVPDLATRWSWSADGTRAVLARPSSGITADQQPERRRSS